MEKAGDLQAEKTLGSGSLIPTTSAEDTLLLLDDVDINRFTNLGKQSYGDRVHAQIPAISLCRAGQHGASHTTTISLQATSSANRVSSE